MAIVITKLRTTGNLFVDDYLIVNNSFRRSYDIKGVETFLNSNQYDEVNLDSSSERDLSVYRKYREKRKRIWQGQKSRKAKLGLADKLWWETVVSNVTKREIVLNDE